METPAMNELANQIVSNQVLNNWEYHLVFLALVFVAASLGSFTSSFFGSKGKSYATKSDFDALLSQLEKTTEVAEKIKREISHEEWELKEFKLVRRQKLEELMYSLYETDHWLGNKRKAIIYGSEKENIQSPAVKASIISWLYFPELTNEASTFKLAFGNYTMWLLESEKTLHKSRNNLTDHAAALSQVSKSFQEVAEPFQQAVMAMELKCQELMRNVYKIGF